MGFLIIMLLLGAVISGIGSGGGNTTYYTVDDKTGEITEHGGGRGPFFWIGMIFLIYLGLAFAYEGFEAFRHWLAE